MTRAAPSAPSPPAARQVAINAAALFLAYVLPRVFTFASVVLAARVLGPRDFGLYGTAAAYAVLVSVVSTLGMQPLLVREIARDPGRAGALLGAAHRIKAGTNVAMLLVLVLLAPRAVGSGPAFAASLVLGVGYALGSWAENLAAYFQAVERMGEWTRASALFGVVSASVGVGLLLGTGSLVAFCWGPAVGWVAAFAWLRARMPREALRRGSASGAETGRLLRGLVPFAAAFVGVTVYSKVDVLILAALRDSVEVGVYAAAYKFVDIFQALVIVGAGAVFPRLARTVGGGGTWRAGRSTELVLIGAVPAGAALHLVAGPATATVFGASYGAAEPVVRTLAVLLPFLAISIHGGYVLAAAGRMGRVALLYAGAVAVDVALVTVLVPGAGAAGAALARVSTEILLSGGILLALRAEPDAAPRAGSLALALGAVGVGVVASTVPDATGGWLRLAVATGGWAGLYGWAGAVSREEIRAVRIGLLDRGSVAA